MLPELVLIGSSTGGPTALSEVLTVLPRDFPAPVVIAQHIPASFTKHLAQRLNDDCAVEVREVSTLEELRPGTVYLGRGDADVVIGRRPGGLTARSVPASTDYRWHPSVDRLVASALSHCLDPRRLVGVLLTGMGDDGAEEMTRLRELGGRTIAESEATAVVFGMPGDLVRRDGADVVLPVHRIGAQLGAWT
jgi:two-component system chemotaxis response regulator CheB